MNTVEAVRLGEELGLDAVGVAPAEAYAETERHIVERRRRGLFAGMKFTMAQPERSCHPETLLDDARTVVSAALCYWEAETPLEDGQGRLARYTWADGYAALGERLDLLGRRLGGDYRVLVDANQHVDREAAARSGVGFYGKNTMLITRRHGSWVVLGTLITTVELERDPTIRRRLRRVPSLHRRVSDRRSRRAGDAGLDEVPLVLDAGSGGDPGAVPPGARRAGVRLRHLPGRVPLEPRGRKRRAGRETDAGHVDLGDWLAQDGEELVDAYARLYVPRNDPRWLRRNALVALGNVGGPEHLPVLTAIAAGDDEIEREHAAWAVERIESRA